MRNVMKWSSTALIASLITLAPASMAMADPASTLSASASYVVAAQGMNDVTVNWTTNGDTPVTDVTLSAADGSTYTVDNPISDTSATSTTFLNVPSGLGDTVTVTDSNGDSTSTTLDVGDNSSSPIWVSFAADPTAPSLNVGNLAVRWTSSLNDTTGFTVNVYDDSGNQVASVDLGADQSAYDFPQLPIGQYTVTVTAHSDAGDISQTSLPTSVGDPNGNYDGYVWANSIAQSDGTYCVSVSWNDNSTALTGFDVTLLDANGNVVETQSVDGATRDTTFYVNADTTGYQVQITAHDSYFGDQTFTAVPVMHLIPLDGGVGGTIDTGITVDPSTIHVDYSENSTWTISWTEPDGVSSGMDYLVTTSAGNCDVAANAPGDYASCVISNDTQPTVSGIEVASHVMYFDKQSGGPVTTTTLGTPEPIAYAAGAPEPRSANGGVTHAMGALPAGHSSSSMIWLVGGAAGLVALLGALATFLRRRQI